MTLWCRNAPAQYILLVERTLMDAILRLLFGLSLIRCDPCAWTALVVAAPGASWATIKMGFTASRI